MTYVHVPHQESISLRISRPVTRGSLLWTLSHHRMLRGEPRPLALVQGTLTVGLDVEDSGSVGYMLLECAARASCLID